MADGTRTLFVNLSEVKRNQGGSSSEAKEKIRRGEESGVECQATTSLRRSEIHRGGERGLPRVELRERAQDLLARVAIQQRIGRERAVAAPLRSVVVRQVATLSWKRARISG